MLLMAKPETLKRMLIEQHINPNIADNINNGYESQSGLHLRTVCVAADITNINMRTH